MKRVLVLLMAMMFVGMATSVQAEFVLLQRPLKAEIVDCDGGTVFENVKIGPENIWAPTNKKLEIDISGTVVAAPGCEVEGAYTMESNDGPVAGDFVIAADGNFTLKIPITVSKNGKEKEGSTYNGTLSVVDGEGNKTSHMFFVTVDHNRGKK